MNRIAIYIRVSTLYQVDKDSLPMQRKDLLAYSEAVLGTKDCVIFEDAGYSGKNTDRPQFQEMMKRARDGEFTHILVWKIDRISRNLLDFATMYTELKRLGVTFVSKNEQFDTSTAMGEAMLKIILVFAELERNMTSERVTATMIARANDGKWNGGIVPFGYDYDKETQIFTLNKNESSVVRQIFDIYEETTSTEYVAKFLNNNELLPRSKSPWYSSTVTNLLRNTFYTGDYAYNMRNEAQGQYKNKEQWIVIPNHHPAIISKEQFEKVARYIGTHEKLSTMKAGRFTRNTHIFLGLLYCENCDKRFTTTSPTTLKSCARFSRYYCITARVSPKCNLKTISDKYLIEFVFNLIHNILKLQEEYQGKAVSLSDIQNSLLQGRIFMDIETIPEDELHKLGEALNIKSMDEYQYKTPVYRKPSKTDHKQEISKLERALERLRKLYLYSDDGISEVDYISEQKRINDRLQELRNRSLEEELTDINDEELINQASALIMSVELLDGEYIESRYIVESVEVSVLKDFTHKIIERIYIKDNRVSKIVFKNGLELTFGYKSI